MSVYVILILTVIYINLIRSLHSQYIQNHQLGLGVPYFLTPPPQQRNFLITLSYIYQRGRFNIHITILIFYVKDVNSPEEIMENDRIYPHYVSSGYEIELWTF